MCGFFYTLQNNFITFGVLHAKDFFLNLHKNNAQSLKISESIFADNVWHKNSQDKTSGVNSLLQSLAPKAIIDFHFTKEDSVLNFVHIFACPYTNVVFPNNFSSKNLKILAGRNYYYEIHCYLYSKNYLTQVSSRVLT